MKTALISIILPLTFFTSIMASANEEVCEGNAQAQIRAVIEKVETDSMHYCKAIVGLDSLSHFSVNGNCPLYLSEIINAGIDYPLNKYLQCELSEGKAISGVLIKKLGRISFEK